jgi:hypothetical protein
MEHVIFLAFAQAVLVLTEAVATAIPAAACGFCIAPALIRFDSDFKDQSVAMRFQRLLFCTVSGAAIGFAVGSIRCLAGYPVYATK